MTLWVVKRRGNANDETMRFSCCELRRRVNDSWMPETTKRTTEDTGSEPGMIIRGFDDSLPPIGLKTARIRSDHVQCA